MNPQCYEFAHLVTLNLRDERDEEKVVVQGTKNLSLSLSPSLSLSLSLFLSLSALVLFDRESKKIPALGQLRVFGL